MLEIGTLGGYSTIWLARAVGAEGRVVTVEAEAQNAAVARASIDAAGVGDRVDIRIGRGADVLPTLVGGFDLVFIDATRNRTRSISTGRRSWATPAPSSSSTTSGARGRSSATTRPTPRWSAPETGCGCWGRTPASTPPRCRRWESRGGTASHSPSWCEQSGVTPGFALERARLGADRRRSTHTFSLSKEHISGTDRGCRRTRDSRLAR